MTHLESAPIPLAQEWCMRYCVHPGCRAKVKRGRCAEHRRAYEAMDRRERGTSAERMYDAKWRRIRNRHIKSEPLCRPCRFIGRTTAAHAVDHVIPHRGDRWLFYADWDFQSICQTCHNVKTAGERDGWVDVLYPLALPESTGNVTVVAGPPASGKTTLAQERADTEDVVIDLDRIHAGNLHANIRKRNRILAQALRTGRTVWFITTGMRRAHREFWRGKLSAGLVVLDTQEDECVDREHERGGELVKVIREWWAWHRIEERAA